MKGTRLDIPRLSKEDAGNYQCHAQNEVGSAKDSITVSILCE